MPPLPYGRTDRQRVLWYYEDTKHSPTERKPTTNFARAFVGEYK